MKPQLSENRSGPSLGVFSLAMINVAAIASLRDLPQMAKYGWGSVFFYLLAGLVFFIPVSLVAAELATGWPQKGVIEAIDTMLSGLGIPFLGHLLATMMAFGVIGSVNSWIIGPSKGILAAAEDGLLPRWFCKTNRHGVPKRLLIIQALIVSLLCLTFTLQPTVATAYFMLSDLTIQLYLIMYVAMFAAAIRLRYTQPDTPRSFRVPMDNLGLWVVAGIGILGAVGCVFIGFFPPAQLADQHIRPGVFVGFLTVGILFVSALPYAIRGLLKKE